MSIKSQGGVFGRNPTFNDVTVEGDLSIAGTLSVGGETITGLSYQGGWNASTNSPDIAASGPVTGQFWIVSADGSTDVGGITNWTQGDWALYDGSAWQRVEGGNTDLTTGVQGQLAVANGGTGAADAATARTNLGLGSAATTASTDYATAAQGSTADSALQPTDIGSTVQAYDADTAKYDDATANFTGTLQNGGSNVVVDSDIGSTVQAYDADTAKYDDATAAFTGNLSVDTNVLYVDATNNRVGVNTSSPLSALTSTNSGALTLDSNDGDHSGFGLFITPSTITANTVNSAIGFGKDSGRKYAAIGMQTYGDTDQTGLNFYIQNTASGSSATLTESLRLNYDGNVEISNGNLVIGTSGKGIDFSATSGTGTSELLDDYEEGTWSGTVTAGAGTISSYTFSGSYTKVGRIVCLEGSILIINNGTGASQVNVTVPFTISGAVAGAGNENNVAGYDLTVIAASSTSIGIRKYDWSYPGSASARLNFQVTYKV